MTTTSALHRATGVAALVGLLGAALGVGIAGATIVGPGEVPGSDAALTTPFALIDDRDVEDRLDQPEDRFALASGCYVVATPDGHLARDGDAVTADATRQEATPLHFRAAELGTYLLAASEGPSEVEGADWDQRSYLTATDPLTGLLSSSLTLAAEPSEAAEWTVVATGEDPDARDEDGQTYSLTAAGPTGDTTLDDVRFHLADGCARWPEVDTNTSGEPAPNPAGPAAPVRGFFEAHVHGMAYEFLGGDLRCGQPWHRWGVEYALPDCQEDGKVLNGTLEVLLAGESPESPITTYDPVGWPTFQTWPKHNTLTHEQWYWKWLERAYHGGLRLTTVLLVENTALCQLYPDKKNSCNEMDSVRLQAKRMFQFQDYIDAQSGGPGEGWLRIVTTPAQAREVINDGRMAVVLGIEISELFDCREVLDQPQCTPEEIEAGLDEVANMGVRQMEMINKFDNALSGVTGDGGSTGVLVNTGQRYLSGHYWDMRTCPEAIPSEGYGHSHAGDQHDKTQINFSDDAAMGEAPGEIDVLAGTLLDLFGPAGAPTPTYPAGPHCNTRGLTDLGRQVIDGMVDRGILFDPDHMSALGQREALDHLEDVVVPRLHERAEAEGRPTRIPGVLSSHSWGNDVIYQRIFDLDGVVAPRTAAADRFVQDYAERRDWHAEHAPDGAFFGMGYGADTNGLGGQPGPRSEPATPIDYDGGFPAPIGDVTIFQQTSGVRSYDVTTDGVAHYGLFADWFRELQLSATEQLGSAATAQMTEDLLNGPEDYLRTWERAVYGGGSCVVDGSTPQVDDLHALIGMEVERFLEAIGQPVDRSDSAYVYCALDEDGDPVTVEVPFDEDGQAGAPDDEGATPVQPTAPDHDHDDGVAAPAGGIEGGGAPAGDGEDAALAATGGGGALVALGLVGLAVGTLRRRR